MFHRQVKFDEIMPLSEFSISLMACRDGLLTCTATAATDLVEARMADAPEYRRERSDFVHNLLRSQMRLRIPHPVHEPNEDAGVELRPSRNLNGLSHALHAPFVRQTVMLSAEAEKRRSTCLPALLLSLRKYRAEKFFITSLSNRLG